MLQLICSLAPESIIQIVGGEAKGIPEDVTSLAEMLKATRGKTLMLFEAGPEEVDAGATKLACCNKDTS